MSHPLALNERAAAEEVRRAPPLHVVQAPIDDDLFERLELRYGPGGFGPLDDDDIEAMIAQGKSWMPRGTR